MPARYSVNAVALADQWLKALGWPSTPVTRRVLAAWFMRESAHGPKKGDIIVVGNNPLNISCRSCSNYRSVGSHKIVVYDSNQAGIAAFNQLIHGHGPGYAGIVKAFNEHPNDAMAIILAINKSGWVTGTTNSYIYNGKNGLAATYNSIGSGDIPTGYNLPSTGITAFGVTFEEGHIMTQADLDKIEAAILKQPNSPFDGVDGAIAEKIFHDTMQKVLLGKPWNDANIKALSAATHVDANNAAIQPTTPGINVAVNVFGALAGKAAAVGAIAIGLGLVVMAAYLISKDIYSQNGTGIVSPTPIFVRD